MVVREPVDWVVSDCESTDRHAAAAGRLACSHLLCVKGGMALLALAAVALTMEKPAGGAVELWLGCTSFGMPLWEAS